MSKAKAAQQLFKWADEAIYTVFRSEKKLGPKSKVTDVRRRKWKDGLDDIGSGYTSDTPYPELFQAPLNSPQFDVIDPPGKFSLSGNLRNELIRAADGSVMLKPGSKLTPEKFIKEFIKEHGDSLTAAQKKKLRANARLKTAAMKSRSGDVDNSRALSTRDKTELANRNKGELARRPDIPDEWEDVIPSGGSIDDPIDAAFGVPTGGGGGSSTPRTSPPPRPDASNSLAVRSPMPEYEPPPPMGWWAKQKARARRFFEAGTAEGAYGRADARVTDFAKRKWDAYTNAPFGVKMLGALGTADIGLMAGPALARAAGDSVIGKALGVGDERDREMSALLDQSRQYQMMRAYEQAKENQRIEQNALELAKNAPDIFEQVMAGRMLPTDGVAIGGQRRVDLLEAVAGRMGTGMGVPQQPNPDDLLNMLMGGGSLQ